MVTPTITAVNFGMTTVSNLIYSLDSTRKVNWTTTHEGNISREYPFDLENETPDQYVARTYLQFLWLPQSLMPLHLLVPSLLRVNVASNSTAPSVHPLHSLLEPICSRRGHCQQISHGTTQILLDQGGAGEIEETMMWFAVSHERANGSQQTSEHATGPWIDAQWRQQWLEKMERRCPITPSYEDRLESFMDKLSMWQLAARLFEDLRRSSAEERDWMQVFSEDIQIAAADLCTLLHEKLFPHSPFSDASSARTESRSPSPDNLSLNRAASSGHISRYQSPSLPTWGDGDSVKPNKDKVRALARSRSRSLSTSLAKERELERAGSVGAINGKKRALNREVSMSRVFKPKPKPAEATQANVKKEAEVGARLVKSKQDGITLVASTPVKKRTLSRTPSVMTFIDLAASPEPLNSPDFGGGNSPLHDSCGDILVVATPTKASRKR
ncbi:hypothetical protein BD779DRAFT_1534745 [Infundibulicybe gibba]|nr:hypothetical protein BD779DRAFT_1534745 [Infundibulicybe gibba]